MPDTPATPEQIELIRNSGAGPVADMARAGGENFTLSAIEISNHGAGFVSDMLRMQKAAVPPSEEIPHVAAIENIANQNPANVKVSAADHPYFGVDTLITFADTGVPELDDPARPPYVITSVNTVGKTFKFDADLSHLPASVVQGSVANVVQQAQLELALLQGEPKWQQPQKSPKSSKVEPARPATITAKSKQTAAPPQRKPTKR